MYLNPTRGQFGSTRAVADLYTLNIIHFNPTRGQLGSRAVVDLYTLYRIYICI